MLPEQRLVLAVCRSSLTSVMLSEIVKSTEPAYAVALAADLGVLGLVSDQMRKLPGADSLWQKAWYTNMTRNLLLVRELRRWVSELSTAGISSIIFKGPALAKLAFGDLGRRDCDDLDLIVPLHKFRHAFSVCRASGWAPVSDQGVLPSDDARLTKVTLQSSDQPGYTLDLHAGWQPSWGRLSGRRVLEDDLADVELTGTHFQTLGEELALVHAARHLVQHRFALKTLIDVAAVLRQVRTHGAESAVHSRAREMGLGRILSSAIRAADEFVALERAPSVSHGLGDPWVLASPGLPERVDLWMWFDLRRGYPVSRLIREILLTLWPSDARMRELPEWVGADHLTFRRVLRPLRLITLFLRSARPAGPPRTAEWRTHSPTGAPSDPDSA